MVNALLNDDVVTLDKISAAIDVATLQKLLQQAKDKLQKIGGSHANNLRTIESHAKDRKVLTDEKSFATNTQSLKSCYEDAMAEAKTAKQNTSYAIMICERLMQAEPHNSETYKKEIASLKETISNWADTAEKLAHGSRQLHMQHAAKPVQSLFSGKKSATVQSENVTPVIKFQKK